MIILARASITLTHVADIVSVTWYYKLQASTAAVPAKPTTETPSGWTTTEPTYTEGSTNSLYIVQKTTLSDGSFEYSDVSLSSSYEAAKTAYNKSVQAKDTADAAQESIDNLSVGGRNLILNTAQARISPASSGGSAYVMPSPYITNYGDEVLNNTDDYFTYSFDYEVTGNSAAEAFIYVQIRGSTVNSSSEGYASYVKDASTGRHCCTFRLTSSQASGTSLYAGIRLRHATDGAVLTVKNIKLEKGNKPTDWTPAPEDLEQLAEDAKQVATNYVTDITGGGILVHPEDNEEDGVKIHDAIEIIKDGVTYIKLWLDGANQDQPKIQVGDSANGAYFQIEQDKLSGKSQSHSYFETGEAGTTVKQVYRGDGINRQFGLYRASSVTSVTVNGSAVTDYTLQQSSPTTYGLLTFGENSIPPSDASIVIIYETTEQNPYFTFGTRDTESEVELPNGTMSATFGKKNNASGPCSFAEGEQNTVTGTAGHAEGDSNNVYAHAGHAEGGMNEVTGNYSHAEGYNNTVSGKYSHAGGAGNSVPYDYQTVIGYGAPIATSDDLFMAGNMDVTGERSAAMRLKRSGRVEFGGAVGSGLTWDTRTEMINAMTGLRLNRPYSFYAGATWTNTAGAGSAPAFGMICKTSTTDWHLFFMTGGKVYKSLFTYNGATSGTFSTTQVG